MAAVTVRYIGVLESVSLRDSVEDVSPGGTIKVDAATAKSLCATSDWELVNTTSGKGTK